MLNCDVHLFNKSCGAISLLGKNHLMAPVVTQCLSLIDIDRIAMIRYISKKWYKNRR